MAFLSSFYPQPVVAGTTEGTFAEGDDPRIVGALPAATAGTGSVLASGSNTARTLSARFGEVFHVDDFGAKGDWNGTTGTDDRASIQAAINAALTTGGGIIRFSPRKTYLLGSRVSLSTTYGTNTDYTILSIVNSTPSLKLYFEGNGATLYATPTPPNHSHIITIVSNFDSIVFDGITFQRAPHLVTPADGLVGTTGIIAYPDETNTQPSKLLGVYNCTFIDTRLAIAAGLPNVLAPLDKLDRFECVSCSFLFPRGSSYAWSSQGGFASGNQTVNLSRWINNAFFDKIYFDGCVGNVLPEDVDVPVDGFNYIEASHTVFTNCYFKNNYIETLISGRSAGGHSISLAPFVQPSIGGSVVATVTFNFRGSQNADRGERLKVGNIYMLRQGFEGSARGIGFYKLTSFTGNYAGWTPPAWDNTTPKGTITLLRVSETSVGSSKNFNPISIGQTTLASSMYDVGECNRVTCNITNCVFDYRNPVELYPKNITANISNNTFSVASNTNLGANAPVIFRNLVGGSNVLQERVYYVVSRTNTSFQIANEPDGSPISIGSNITSGTVHALFLGGAPCIAAWGANTTITNCSFLGNGGIVLHEAQEYFPIQPVIATNNTFWFVNKYRPARGQYPYLLAAALYRDNAVFIQNICIAQDSEDLRSFLSAFGENLVVKNNSFIVRNRRPIGSGTDEVPYGTILIQWLNGNQRIGGISSGGWANEVEDNFVQNVDYYSNTNDGVELGSYSGNFVVGHAFPTSQPVRLRSSKMRSPDGSLWALKITNNGELEVTK